jgi:hypothetical protein
MGAQDEALYFPAPRRAGHVPTSFSDEEISSLGLCLQKLYVQLVRAKQEESCNSRSKGCLLSDGWIGKFKVS